MPEVLGSLNFCAAQHGHCCLKLHMLWANTVCDCSLPVFAGRCGSVCVSQLPPDQYGGPRRDDNAARRHLHCEGRDARQGAQEGQSISGHHGGSPRGGRWPSHKGMFLATHSKVLLLCHSSIQLGRTYACHSLLALEYHPLDYSVMSAAGHQHGEYTTNLDVS